MALKIKKTSENGIVTTYHRIASVSILFFEDGNSRVAVTVRHYANGDYRQKNGDLNADASTVIISSTVSAFSIISLQ